MGIVDSEITSKNNNAGNAKGEGRHASPNAAATHHRSAAYPLSGCCPPPPRKGRGGGYLRDLGKWARVGGESKCDKSNTTLISGVV